MTVGMNFTRSKEIEENKQDGFKKIKIRWEHWKYFAEASCDMGKV